LLLDVELLRGNIRYRGTTQAQKAVCPETHILIVTVYEEEMLIFRALGNGAAGDLTKNTPADRIDSCRT
jgi:DNA-binding NarL/FixJ family response regulator